MSDSLSGLGRDKHSFWCRRHGCILAECVAEHEYEERIAQERAAFLAIPAAPISQNGGASTVTSGTFESPRALSFRFAVRPHEETKDMWVVVDTWDNDRVETVPLEMIAAHRHASAENALPRNQRRSSGEGS